MTLTRILSGLAVAALAFMAFDGTASATTLEVGGVTQTSVVGFGSTVKAGNSTLLSNTEGFFVNTCTTSTIEGNDITKTTGTAVEGPLIAFSWGTGSTFCSEGNPTVDARGSISIERIGVTTNGTLKSKNAKVTMPTALGLLTCVTPAEGTDLGTITGAAAGSAAMDINAVLSCGIDTKWTGTYTVTSPLGLGVVG